MTIIRNKKAVCGIQLTVDHVWRYAMQEGETLLVIFAEAKHLSEKLTRHTYQVKKYIQATYRLVKNVRAIRYTMHQECAYVLQINNFGTMTNVISAKNGTKYTC